MTKLHELVAVESGVKSKAEREFTNAYHAIQKEQLFSGITRSYAPKDEEDDQLPPESTKVQQTVEGILANVATSLGRLFDIRLTKDVANQDAVADLVVDGETIATQLPVTFLLTLEKKLVDLRTLIAKLPILDPAEDWSHDETTGAYSTPPILSTKTKKVYRSFVLYPATEKHPAQVEKVTEDVVAGTWTTRKLSGRMTQDRAKGLLDRIDKLSEAVKLARESANRAEVTQRKIGDALFDYLLDRM